MKGVSRNVTKRLGCLVCLLSQFGIAVDYVVEKPRTLCTTRGEGRARN